MTRDMNANATSAEVAHRAQRLDDKLDIVKQELGTFNVVLGTLGVSLRNIEGHLAVLNGSVARHEQRFGGMNEELARIKQEIAVAKTERDTRMAVAAEVGGKYQRWLVPIAKYILAAAAILLLEHGPQVAKVIKP